MAIDVAYHGSIGSKYGSCELALIKEELVIFPKTRMEITEAQFKAVERLDLVFLVFKKTLFKSFQDLKLVGTSASVKAIADGFQRAEASYQFDFINACRNDNIVYTAKTAINCYWCFAWFVKQYRYYSGYQASAEISSSAHRYAWMAGVGAREKARMQDLKSLIEKRALALIDEITRDKAEHIVSKDSIEELQDLAKIFKEFISQEQFEVGVTNVNTFLLENKLGQ
jgi:hypothetical protein